MTLGHVWLLEIEIRLRLAASAYVQSLGFD